MSEGSGHTISVSLLVAQDEERVAQFIRRFLEREHYSVDIAADGDLALDRLNLIPYHLVILDLALPKRGGFEILHFLRQTKNKVPVLILTARSSVADRVKALDLGADDYLVKPFAIEELLARVRTLLRRNQSIRPD